MVEKQIRRFIFYYECIENKINAGAPWSSVEGGDRWILAQFLEHPFEALHCLELLARAAEVYF